MHDVLFHGIAIAALLAGNGLLIALGFLAAVRKSRSSSIRI